MLEKGGRIIGKLKQFLVDFWYLISPLFGFLGEIFNKLEVEFLQKIFYLLSIYCLWLGIREFKRKKKNTLKQPMKPQAQKTVEQSLDPEQQAKLLIEKERKIIRGIKIMLNWIKNNRGSISFALTLIATICGYLIPEFGDLWIIGDVKVLPLVFGSLSLVLGMKSFPMSSSERQEAWNKVNALLTGSKATEEEKEKAKDVRFFKEEVKSLDKKLKALEKEYASVVEEVKRAQKYNLTVATAQREAYAEYLKQKQELENVKAQFESKLATLVNN